LTNKTQTETLNATNKRLNDTTHKETHIKQ